MVQQHRDIEEVSPHIVETSEFEVQHPDGGYENCTTCFGLSREDPIDIGETRDFGNDTQVPVFVDTVKPSLKTKGRRICGSSCPPQAARSLESGPWSLEWLSDQHHSDAGVISSSRKKVKRVVWPRDLCNQDGTIDKKRKIVNGVLRHSVPSLKKVARLPCKDRASVLKILKKKVRKHQGSDRLKKVVDVVSQGKSDSLSSSGSVNNDWYYWVVMGMRR